MSRTKGWPTGVSSCEWMGSATGPTCHHRARVKITIRRRNAQNTEYTQYEMLRCWEHYLLMENVARSSSDIEVVKAELYKPD
jgi:hypothetical protein